jgi:hypothetical protein
MVRGTCMKCFLPWLVALLAAVAVQAHDEVTPKPKLLQNGLPLVQLASERDEQQVFLIVIPPQVGALKFRTTGGKGDCDIFVRHNAHPTLSDYDGASRTVGTVEDITVQNPEAGNWYVLVDAFGGPFRGVTLTASYALAPGAVAIPRLLPAPGVYGGKAKVQLKDATKGATIRYTTDNTPVTDTSPLYSAALIFTATTHLRVAAFGLNNASSPEVAGDYVIQAPDNVTPLVNGTPLFHRCGLAGSRQIFKINVSADQKHLRIFTEGGPGNTELLASFGAPPAANRFHRYANGPRNFNTLVIKDPKPGDWFVMLRGRSNFSGVSILATARSQKADLIAWAGAVNPYVHVQSFTEDDCEVQEGFTTAGTHTLLRFDTETRNIGGGDLVLPDPETRPDLFEFAACHGHFHFKGFASYRLLDSGGVPVALGKKVSFCLEDISRWDRTAKRAFRYTCSDQGIQSGWADIYDAGLPGQWIDITGVPNGTYTLEITMDPLHVLDEADFTNNTVTTEVVLGGEAGM